MLDVLIFEFQKKKIWLPGEPSDIVHFVSHVNRASLASSNARTICFSNFEAKNFIALIVATNQTGYRLPVSTTTTPSIMLVGKHAFWKVIIQLNNSWLCCFRQNPVNPSGSTYYIVQHTSLFFPQFLLSASVSGWKNLNERGLEPTT